MAIRICQLITDLRLSGAERVVYELSRRLNRSRFDVRVAALRGGEVEQMLLAQGIPVTVLGVRGRWDLGKLRPLVRLLRQHKIDLLHTHLFHSDFAGRAAAIIADVPHLVHTIHVAEQRFRPWQYAYARLMDFQCDRLICVSRSVRDHHAARSHLPLSRYTIIPNGVDLETFGPNPAQGPAARARTRQQWGLSPRQIAVLFVGRLNHQKGVDVLLAAMSQLAHNGGPRAPELRFVLAGDGPERSRVEQYMMQGAGLNCRLLGFVADVREALNAADIFVLPSRWEGWPLALAEAMAAGLPCVGTDVPGIRDIIEDGRTGLLVPSEDPTALAQAIRKLTTNAALREALVAAGREEITRNYSIQRNVAAHEKVYQEVAALP